jgi:hypothetical protein
MFWVLGLVGLAACGSPEVLSASSHEHVGRQAQALNGGVITQAADNARDGWYQDEPTLTPALVGSPQFGQLWSAPVNGQVYAQPLGVGSTLFVATEKNWIYSLDQATGAVLAARQVEPNDWQAADLQCGDLTPDVGITGTPVIDTATNTAYFFAKSYARVGGGAAIWQAHAVDATTLVERCGFPVIISGVAQNDSTLTFDPTHQAQRAGLLLLNGVVYAGFGSHCDTGPYQGWIAGVSTSGQLVTLWTTEPGQGPDANGAIWQGGSGLASDGDGSIFFATGNGTSPSAPVAGSTPPNALGDAVVHVAVQGNGTLRATDFFMPHEATTMDPDDLDLGSGGTVLLPDAWGTATVPHTAVQIGKEGILYLLNRDSLGGYQQGSNGGDQVVQEVTDREGDVYGRPAVWPGDTGYVYLTTSTGFYDEGAGPLYAYAHGVGAGQPTLTFAGQSTDTFDANSGSPVVSSDGTTSGSALVWTVRMTDESGANAELRAYDAVPVDGTLHLRFRAPVGTAAKFASPGLANGRVFVGTRDGTVVAFGQLAQSSTGDAGTDAVAQSSSSGVGGSGSGSGGSGGGSGSGFTGPTGPTDPTADAQDEAADVWSDPQDATVDAAAGDDAQQAQADAGAVVEAGSDEPDPGTGGGDGQDTAAAPDTSASAPATIRLVQSAKYESDGQTVTVMTATLTRPVTATDLLVVEAYTWNSTGLVAISDSAGNAWHHALFQPDPQQGTNGIDVWYAYNAKASAKDVVSVTMATHGAYEGLVVAEYSGVQWTADPLDVAVGAAHTGFGDTAPTVGLTTATRGELIVSGAAGACAGETTAGAGSTLEWGLDGIGAIFLDRLSASAGATSATSGPADCDWTITATAFQPAH